MHGGEAMRPPRPRFSGGEGWGEGGFGNQEPEIGSQMRPVEASVLTFDFCVLTSDHPLTLALSPTCVGAREEDVPWN